MSGRRDFLNVSAVLGGALGGGLLSTRLFDSRAMAMAPKPLRILILGGTGFIGSHQVRYALAQGHRVTLFNRDRTNAGMFTGGPNLELLLGDREPKPGNYESLKGREWDAVIDNPARRPRWVREAAAAVKGHAKQCVFTVRQMLEGIRDTVKSSATFAYTTSAFLRAQQPPVRGWADLPVWVAPEGSYAGFTQRSIAKALSVGLTFRPYADTVGETIAFYKAQTPERQEALRAGIKPEREEEVLAAWHAKQRS